MNDRKRLFGNGGFLPGQTAGAKIRSGVALAAMPVVAIAGVVFLLPIVLFAIGFMFVAAVGFSVWLRYRLNKAAKIAAGKAEGHSPGFSEFASTSGTTERVKTKSSTGQAATGSQQPIEGSYTVVE